MLPIPIWYWPHSYTFPSVKLSATLTFWSSVLPNSQITLNVFKLEMGPDPTRAYFWPAVNKRPTQVLSDPTQPKVIFFDPKGKKLKNLPFLGEIFKIQTQTINVWPDPTWIKKFCPRPITNLNHPLPEINSYSIRLVLFLDIWSLHVDLS